MGPMYNVPVNSIEKNVQDINSVRFGFVNINGSVSLRADSLVKYMLEKEKLDIFFVVETWLLPKDPLPPHLKPLALTDLRSERAEHAKRGKDGVIVLVKESVKSMVSIIHISSCKRWVVLKVADYFVACGYFPPKSAKKEEILEFVSFLYDCEEIVWEKLMIVGDFNARLGDITGDSVSNDRKTFFRDQILQAFGLHIVPTTSDWKYTTVTSTGNGITDLLLCSAESSIVFDGNGVKVDKNESFCGSDHRPLSWSVQLLKTYSIPRFSRYNRARLDNPEYSRLFTKALNESFFDIMSYAMSCYNDVFLDMSCKREKAQRVVDDLYLQFLHYIDEAALKSIGLVHVDVGCKPNKDFETDKIKTLRKEIDAMFANITLLDPSTSKYNRKGLFKKASRVLDEHKQAVYDRRYELFEDKCNQWAQTGNSTMFLKNVSAIKRRESRSGNQLDPEKINTHAQHFRSTFGHVPKGVHVPLESLDEILSKEEKSNKFSKENMEEWMGVFCTENIQKSLHFFANGKASGPDHIFAELLKHEDELVSQVLSLLFKICYRFTVVPDMWLKANVVPIYKNKGDINDIANYRPISLTCVIRRVYERVLLSLLQPITESILTPNQGGFRSKRGTLQQSYALEELMKKYPLAAVVFLDIKAAYDTVNRPLLWRDMSLYGIHVHLIAVCRSLFDYNVCNLVVSGRKSDDIECLRGLLQGSSLSPLLFNLYIHSLILRLNDERHPKLVMGGDIELNNLFFADDGALVALIPHIQPMLDTCDVWGEEYGTDWAPLKSATMLPPKDVLESSYSSSSDDTVFVPSSSSSSLAPFVIQGGEIPFVEEFVYLGTEVASGKGIVFEKKFEERIAKMISTALFLKRKGMHTFGWRFKTSVLAYKSFLRSSIEYGVCFMNMKKESKKAIEKMEVAQNRVINMFLSSSGNSSKGAKLKLFKLCTMAARVEFLQYRFVENLRSRCPRDAPASRIWHALVKEDICVGGDAFVPSRRGRSARLQQQRRQHTNMEPALDTTQATDMQKMFLANDIVQFVLSQKPNKKDLDKYTRQRCLSSMASYDKVKENNKFDIAKSIDTPRRLGGLSAYTDPSVSREDQRVLIGLRIGDFAFHQECAVCGQACSREHASICSGDALRLVCRFPQLHQVYRHDPQVSISILFQDYLLNRMDALYCSRDPVLWQEAQDIMQELIVSAKAIRGSVSGYVQTEKTWYHPAKKKLVASFLLLNKQKPTHVNNGSKRWRRIDNYSRVRRPSPSTPRILLNFDKPSSPARVGGGACKVPLAKSWGQNDTSGDDIDSPHRRVLRFHKPSI